MEQLRTIVTRIQGEIARISALRSSDPTIVSKKTKLEKLVADIQEMIEKIERKKLKLEEVPIHPNDAEKFLKSITSDDVPEILTVRNVEPEIKPNVKLKVKCVICVKQYVRI